MKPLAPLLQQTDQTHVRFRNRELSYFGGCDYFRLSSHPAVVAALQNGLRQYGLNVAASRKTTGNHPLYEKLEKRLADFFDAQDAVLFSNGYATNLAVAQALAGDFSHVLIDERSHASLVDASTFFDCPIIRFPFRNSDAVARIIKRIGRQSRPVLLTDGMFSHDGGLAPVSAYLEVLPRDAMVLLDDAHGAGILGTTGKGTLEQLGVRSNRVIQTISLSKAFGVYGGAIPGSRVFCDRIRQKSRLFGGNTPLLLPAASACLRALQIVKRDPDPAMRRRLKRNTLLVNARLRQAGLAVTDPPTPIVALTPRRTRDAELLSRKLLARRIYPGFIRYPGGAASGYFRFAISSEHSAEQLENLTDVLSESAPAAERQAA